MGENKEDIMKKYVDISGFGIRQPNRGNSALSYGAISFLMEKGLLTPNQELISFQYFRNPFKAKYLRQHTEILEIAGIKWKRHVIPVFGIEEWLCRKYGILLSWTRYGRMMRQVAYEAADYGGDGFSDIYGDKLFKARLNQTIPFMALGIPLIILPQTIGPFKKKENYDLAIKIMKYAQMIYVRDSKFENEFEKMGLKYEQTKDLSAFMLPEPWDIDIKPNSIGINVSGLAYSNNFKGLEGQFDVYPDLIDRIICHFRDKGHVIYLIPHSYRYGNPEFANDDMWACHEAYNRLQDKTNVIFVDKELTSPQVKYVISQMSFFVGTRMHANFAAIYTNVPLFGLAYSYKFEGAFYANGLDGKEQTARINNIKNEDIDIIVEKIYLCYLKKAI